jgi:hypothetical protein
MTDTVMGYAARIAPELEPFAVPIDSVHPHPENPREHRLEHIAAMLQEHGQRSLVIVDARDGTIVKGNGTWEAAKMLGWDQIAVLPETFGDTAIAVKYMLGDNKASDHASYQRRKLMDVLQKMYDGPGLMGTLFDAADLEDLREEFTPIATLPEIKGDVERDADVPDQVSERTARPGDKLHEVPLLFSAADHIQFMEAVDFLAKEWATSGVMRTILRAVLWCKFRIEEDKDFKAERVPEVVSPLRAPTVEEAVEAVNAQTVDPDFPL